MQRALRNFITLSWHNGGNRRDGVYVPTYLDIVDGTANIDDPIIIYGGYEFNINQILATIILTMWEEDLDPQDDGFREGIDFLRTGIVPSNSIEIKLDFLRHQLHTLYHGGVGDPQREIRNDLRGMIDQIITSLVYRTVTPYNNPEQYRIRCYLYAIKYAFSIEALFSEVHGMISLLASNVYGFDDSMVNTIRNLSNDEICANGDVTVRASNLLAECLSYIAPIITDTDNMQRLIDYIAAIEYAIGLCNIDV